MSEKKKIFFFRGAYPLNACAGYLLYFYPSLFSNNSIYAPKCEKSPAKTLVFQDTKRFASTGYYGIEDPFPDLISKLCHFRGIRSADCWLSRAIGSRKAVILKLRSLLLL